MRVFVLAPLFKLAYVRGHEENVGIAYDKTRQNHDGCGSSLEYFAERLSKQFRRLFN